MHDEDRLACGQKRKPGARARDLVDKTFAAGRPVAGGRFPEFAIGRAEFAFEFVVTPSGPGAKILFAKGGLFDRNETQPARPSPACGAPDCTPPMRLPAVLPSARQSLRHRRDRPARRVRESPRAVRRPARGGSARDCVCARSWLRQPCGEQDKDRGLGHLLGAAEHVAGLAADLPQRQPRDGEPAQARQHRREQRVAP